MPYFDISIPLKLKTLTYKFDEEKDLTGYAVKVYLKNQLVNGLVIQKRENLSDDISSKIKNIEKIIGKAYNLKFIEFIKWLSDYYLVETGSVLRATFFEEIIKIMEDRKKLKTLTKSVNFIDTKDHISTLNIETLSKIYQILKDGDFKTLLIHCPDLSYEMSLMVEVAKKISDCPEGIILLMLPEIKDAEILFSILQKEINEKVLLLHSNMKTSELLLSINKIKQNEVKVIVGTRFAIFAPVEKLSLIMVAQESSWLYKAEESPRYNARDCAVMRGFIEKCPVILTDFMPSTASFYNAVKDKYQLIDDFTLKKHPEIKIVKQPYESVFHEEVSLFIKLHAHEGILITVPRVGYSMLRCNECGNILRCEKCSNALSFNKSERTLTCSRCIYTLPAIDTCPNCGSINLKSLGTGIEKIKEELKKFFKEKEASVRELTDSEDEYFHNISITTASKTKKTYLPKYKAALIVEFDFFLSIPDYRAPENAFKKILSISQFVKPEGVIFIQTREQINVIFKFIRSYDFKSFYNHEIKNRKEIGFPPLARLIKLKIKTKENNIDTIKEILTSSIPGNISGPHYDKLKNEFIFILRSRDKQNLTQKTSYIIGELKKIKGLSINTEVDPVFLKI